MVADIPAKTDDPATPVRFWFIRHQPLLLVLFLLFVMVSPLLAEYVVLWREDALGRQIKAKGMDCGHNVGWLRQQLPYSWWPRTPIPGDRITVVSFWKQGRTKGPIDDLMPLLRQLRNLKTLEFDAVERVELSVETLASLKQLPIRKVLCENTRCDEDTVVRFAELPGLKALVFMNCNVSRTGLERFKKKRPDVTVFED